VGNDREVEYSNRLIGIEEKPAKEKPPRRQQYTELRSPLCSGIGPSMRRARAVRRQRGGRGQDGVVDLPDRSSREGYGVEVLEGGTPRQSERGRHYPLHLPVGHIVRVVLHAAKDVAEVW